MRYRNESELAMRNLRGARQRLALGARSAIQEVQAVRIRMEDRPYVEAELEAMQEALAVLSRPIERKPPKQSQLERETERTYQELMADRQPSEDERQRLDVILDLVR